MKTPFDAFDSTTTTPDAATGIGRWSDADFVRAMREGLAPGGHAYFPAFPYPSFASRSDDDAIALYLHALPPVRNDALAKREQDPAE